MPMRVVEVSVIAKGGVRILVVSILKSRLLEDRCKCSVPSVGSHGGAVNLGGPAGRSPSCLVHPVGGGSFAINIIQFFDVAAIKAIYRVMEWSGCRRVAARKKERKKRTH